MLDRRAFIRAAAAGTVGSLAAIRLQAQGAGPVVSPPPSPLRITVDPAKTAQRMDGFGASGAFHMAAQLQRFPEDERTRILDLLFSAESGAGLTIVRNLIPDTISPGAGQWNWKTDSDQVWLMQEAAKRGCTRFTSTAWTPPAWMKDNNNTVGGHLRPDKYDAYAEYLAQYVLGYRREHGLNIYSVSPQNEPDVTVKYASCFWNGDQYHRFVQHSMGPIWRRLEVPAKIMLGEDSNWTEKLVVPTLEDPEARGFIDIVASHAYHGNNKAPDVPIVDRVGDFPVTRQWKKPIWETEVSAFNTNDASMDDALYWAKLLHTHVAEDGVSGWLYWWLVTTSPGREALVSLDSQVKSWFANKRLFVLGNYSRFVRPGAVRVAATANPAPGVMVTAYRQGTDVIVVAINDGAAACRAGLAVAGQVPAKAQAYRTSQNEDLVSVGGPAPGGAAPRRFFRAPAISGTGPFTVHLMPKSVTTVILN